MVVVIDTLRGLNFTFNTSTTSITLDRFKPYTPYEIRMRAFTRKGEGTVSLAVRTRTKEDGKKIEVYLFIYTCLSVPPLSLSLSLSPLSLSYLLINVSMQHPSIINHSPATHLPIHSSIYSFIYSYISTHPSIRPSVRHLIIYPCIHFSIYASSRLVGLHRLTSRQKKRQK